MNDDYNPYRPSYEGGKTEDYTWPLFWLRLSCVGIALDTLFYIRWFMIDISQHVWLSVAYQLLRLIISVSAAMILMRATEVKLFLVVVMMGVATTVLSVLWLAGIVAVGAWLMPSVYTTTVVSAIALWLIPGEFKGRAYRRIIALLQGFLVLLGIPSLFFPSVALIVRVPGLLLGIVVVILFFYAFWNFDFEKKGEIRFKT